MKRAAGSGGSVVVDRCQVCDSPDLEPVIFVGFLPPVNTFVPIGTRPAEQPSYPAQLLRCPRCELVQLGLIVDPAILFPPSYAYTSGTTRILRENFAELEAEATPLLGQEVEGAQADCRVAVVRHGGRAPSSPGVYLGGDSPVRHTASVSGR